MEFDTPWPWLTLALGGAAALVLQRGWSRWVFRRRRTRGRRGEHRAEKQLARRGFRVVRRQPSRVLRYRLDGHPIDVTVRGDLLVERRGRHYLAEVKTGRVAPRIESAETRRQLLEYAHAFDVHGILLVDADHDRVRRVGMPSASRRGPFATLGWVALGFAMGAAVGSALPELLRLARRASE